MAHLSIVPVLDDSAEHEPEPSATLADVHEVLWHRQPASDADRLVWVDFHRNNVNVYLDIAAVDVEHRHEAKMYAGMEMRKAREIEHRLNPYDDDE